MGFLTHSLSLCILPFACRVSFGTVSFDSPLEAVHPATAVITGTTLVRYSSLSLLYQDNNFHLAPLVFCRFGQENRASLLAIYYPLAARISFPIVLRLLGLGHPGRHKHSPLSKD